MRRPLSAIALASALLAAPACKDPRDQEAKKRIFAPESPPKYVTRAGEPLGPESLDQSPEHAERVLNMGAAEAAERLGPHQFKGKVEFTWTEGQKQVSLDEDHSLSFGPKGDFTARLDAGDKLGESKQGMEIWRVGGKVFARNRFGKFRERDRDRGAAEKYREEVYGVLPTLYRLFDGRVALTNQGATEHGARRAFKYQVGLAPEAPAQPASEARVPPPAYPKDGPDAHLARLLELDKKKAPTALAGTLFVDAETGCVLDASLRGTLDAPGEGGAKSQLKLLVETRVSEIGKDPQLAPPKDALPDEGRPQGVAAALERFDLPRVHSSDGGVSAAEEEEAP